MQIQLIRNATLRINYAGKIFLTDPFLARKHTLPPYKGVSPNPLVELPMSANDVLDGIEMALISHLHSDHFDSTAKELLNKDLTLFCQPGDESELVKDGFINALPIYESLVWEGITISRTPAQHGSGGVLTDMGNTSGFVFQAENQKSIYWAGDTILYPTVKDIIHQFQPDIILTHSCGAVWGDGVLIIMDAEQTLEVCRAAPQSTVVAIHMEALDHATITRSDLRSLADSNKITSSQLLIPADGEILKF